MDAPPQPSQASALREARSKEVSPWRSLFEMIKTQLAAKRDEHGVIGSINWLRVQMQQRGANPNVVRNIIYRDKGKLEDKRVLFDILNTLWMAQGNASLQVPDLALMLETGSRAEHDILQLLGREKRQLFHHFVSCVRRQEAPKMLVTGRPGSGKTLLSDYIQKALSLDDSVSDDILRFTSSGDDLATVLRKLALGVGVEVESFEARLVKLGASTAFAVQADAQASLARLVLDALRTSERRVVCLFHLSQTLALESEMAGTDLRLNTADVPRVTVAEWLWVNVFEPLYSLPNVSLFLTTVTPPNRDHKLAFDSQVALRPPTASEARRYVKQRLPHLNQEQQESIVQRSKRSFEELRTLTLLTTLKELHHEARPIEAVDLGQLSQLLETSSDKNLKQFLAILAVLSLPEYGDFEQSVLQELLADNHELSAVELAFLDMSGNEKKRWRCFSRYFLKELQARLKNSQPERYRALHQQVAEHYYAQAITAPNSEAAERYLYHLYEARSWESLARWLKQEAIPQLLLSRLWRRALEELEDSKIFTTIAHQVAEHYVRLGSYQHPDVEAAFDFLAQAGDPVMQAWTRLKRAEGAVKRNQFEEAAALLENWQAVDDPFLSAEVELIRASIARWRSDPLQATQHIQQGVLSRLEVLPRESTRGRLLVAKTAVWSGLLAKDQGYFEEALGYFQSVETHDALVKARLDFQSGDVLLQLGRFDEGLHFFNQAVSLSLEGDAPLSEQARYLSRRGFLYRRQHALELACQDHEAALALIRQQRLDLSREFEEAKVQDEYAMTLAALGKYSQALSMLEDNICVFQAYQQAYRVDASYRILRSMLRLAAIYWSRALAIPFAYPLTRARCAQRLPDSLDVQQARFCSEQVHQEIMKSRDPHRHYGSLYRQCLLWRSLTLEDSQQATAWTEQLLADLWFPYTEAQVHVQRSVTFIRQAKFQASLEVLIEAEQALAVVRTTPDERADTRLALWCCMLKQYSLLALGKVAAAIQLLEDCIYSPVLGGYYQEVLHDFGEAATLLGKEQEVLTGLSWLTPAPTYLSLADALVYCWQRRDSA